MSRSQLWSNCVCGALLLMAAQLHADAPPGRYTIAPAGLVTDERTKLVWQRMAAPGSMTWQEAKTHCTNLELAGTGWRLPKYKELMTLVDFTRSNPAIDTSAFPNAPAEDFWTASTLIDNGNPYWVRFATGAGSTDPRGMDMLRVRCVR
jgi:hypothetical protein